LKQKTDNKMKIKTHEPNQNFFNNLVQDGFKSISLFDWDGNRLIQYNNSKVPLKEKIKEVQQRLKVAPNGIYKLFAQFNFSQRTVPTIFYLNKGKVSEEFLSEEQATPIKENSKMSKEEKTTNSVVSLDSALTRIEELSKLRAENEVLKAQNSELQRLVQELENELEEEENNALSEVPGNSVGNWLQNIAPTLIPLADQYFQLQDKKLQLEERKLGLKKQTPGQKRNTRKTKKYPDLNNEQELEMFFNWLEKVDENTFNNICIDTEKNNPQLYELIQQEFFEEEEEEEETETENQ